jgi:hypothetical protein
MTSPPPLERLAGPGNVLAKESPDTKEFAALVRSGVARLKDAENETNSLDSRFDLPYPPRRRSHRRRTTLETSADRETDSHPEAVGSEAQAHPVLGS